MKFVSSVLILLITSSSFAQQSTDPKPPYFKNLSIPDFKISTIKDSSDFSSQNLPKDGLLFIKYFSPDCEHCQEEAEMYVSKKDSLQNIKTLWISGNWADLKMIIEFTKKYKLEKLDPLAIGKENNNYLVSFYELQGMPYGAVYQNNKLIKEYRGSIDFSELISINNGDFKPKPIVPNLKKGN